MLEAIVFGLLVGFSLAVGSIVGLSDRVPKALAGVLLAFASGALMYTTATELIQHPLEEAPAWAIAIAVTVGALAFLGLNSLSDRLSTGNQGAVTLLIGVMVDGIPENLALGSSIGPALLYSIVATNFPEALTGARDMRSRTSWSHRKVVSIWSLGGLLLTFAVLVGYFLTQVVSDETTAVINAFAGGAVVASLFAAAVPEGHEQGGSWAAMGTAVGFVIAAVIA